MEEIIVGVVGVLQFEVLTYRLRNEYNVEVILEKLPFEHIRWVENPGEVDVARIQGTSDMKRIKDLRIIRCCCLSTAGAWAWYWTAIQR